MSKLPKGWEYPKLEEIFEILKGNGLSKGNIVNNGKYKCILYGELYTTYAEVINKVISSTNEEIGVKSKKGDILLPASTTTKGEDLANAVALNEENVLLGGDINIFRMKMNNVDSIFMAHYLTHIKKKDIANLTQGSTIIHLYGKNIKHLQVHLPPLEEQKKIADILSTVDKKIAFVEENINATEELKKGLMQKLLTEGIGHTEFKDSELGRLPESWEIDKLENLTTKIGDGLHGTPKYVEQSDYYFINGNNLNGESIEINKNTKCVNEEEYIKNKKILDNTTILLSINGTVGSLAYYNNENVMLGKSVAYMNVNSKILKQFLFYLLKSSKILEYFILELTGTTIKNLSLKTIRNTRIPLPQLEEQKQIAEILLIVDKKLESLKEKKQSFEELKKGLMQKLLTGEVRL